MTKYICKCGRVVAKSTNADNTGNRDTAGCEGCPYLLPWGPMVWDDQQKGYTQDVKGYECRMSPTLEYASTYHGCADDKCSLHIVSLDLDFLDEVQAWIYDNAAYTLRAGFSRGSIRGIEFSDKGRYSLSILCAPNKKGVAAKAALIEHFFGPDKHRLDMTPQQEKAHILAVIEASKARTQKKEESTVIYKDPATGWLYRVGPEPYQDSYWVYYMDPKSSAFWKRCPQNSLYAGNKTAEGEEEYLRLNAKRNGWVPVDDAPGENPTDAAEDAQPCAPTASDVPPSQFQSVDADAQQGGEDDSGCLASNVGELIKAGSDDRRRVQSRANVECGKISVLHVCAQKPENRKIWLNAMMPAEYWVMNKPGNPCGEHIEICPYCNADLKNGEGDVLIVPFGQSANFTDAAPASPADAGAATQSLSAADPASLAAESAQLAFDYSGLDPKTVDTLHVAEQMIFKARRDAHIQIAQAVSFAHDALCGGVVQNLDNSKHGNRGDESFGCWCKSVGISRSAAYSYLNVASMFFNSTPEEQAALLNTGKSLLAEAAKPSAPAELVQAVKDGDITTHKQYQEAMAMLKERDAKIQELLEMSEAADRRADEAQAWAKKAESDAREAQKERDGARDALQAAKRRGDQWQERAEARQARLQELENRPIQATAVDSDEVDRMVTQRLEEELAKQMPRQQEEQEQAARDAYDAFILTARSLDNLWRTLKPQIARLAPDQKNGAKNLLLQKLMEVKEELIHACEDHQP